MRHVMELLVTVETKTGRQRVVSKTLSGQTEEGLLQRYMDYLKKLRGRDLKPITVVSFKYQEK